MIKELLLKEESKTLEFKENTHSLQNIIKSVIAFANTAGGTIVIGVEDKTKKLVGIEKPLDQEERLINSISESIAPLLVPDIEIQTYKEKEIIIIKVPHVAGPFYIKSVGMETGTYVRSGSTNRLADTEMLDSLKLFAKKTTFDEIPFLGKLDVLDVAAIQNAFKPLKRSINSRKLEGLGVVVSHMDKLYPSNGGVILFSHNRDIAFPDALIRCARFISHSRSNVLDHTIIKSYPHIAVEEAIAFIEKNTLKGAVIGRTKRIDVPQYPPIAIREAIINAIVHADYAIKGSSIMIAIFDDRIEITNPGGLRMGMTLEDAIAGSSKVRNRVIARVFNELQFIEQWGSGLKKIIEACEKRGLEKPIFEDKIDEFKVTLFATQSRKTSIDESQKKLLRYLKKKGQISTKEAAEFWDIAPRNARIKLKSLFESGIIMKVGSSEKDPRSGYILVQDIEEN